MFRYIETNSKKFGILNTVEYTGIINHPSLTDTNHCI